MPRRSGSRQNSAAREDGHVSIFQSAVDAPPPMMVPAAGFGASPQRRLVGFMGDAHCVVVEESDTRPSYKPAHIPRLSKSEKQRIIVAAERLLAEINGQDEQEESPAKNQEKAKKTEAPEEKPAPSNENQPEPVRPPPTPAEAHDEDVVRQAVAEDPTPRERQGWLEKFAPTPQRPGNWTRLYFVLPEKGDPPELLWYNTEDDFQRGVEVAGRMPLVGPELRVITRRSTDESNDNNRVFLIVERAGKTERKVIVRSPSVDVHREWAVELRKRSKVSSAKTHNGHLAS